MNCDKSAEFVSLPADGTTKSPIIYGNARDVEQSRGQWRHAENASTTTITIQQMKVALASRGTAWITGPSYLPDSSGDICGTTLTAQNGSGLLASSTRVVTAAHIARPIIAGDDAQAPRRELYFEATGASSGDFVEDAYSNGDPMHHWDREYCHNPTNCYATKFNSAEQNPLLPNRLAALGIEQLDEDEAIQFFRGPWPWDIEQDQFSSVFDPSRDLDIAVLRVTQRQSPFRADYPASNWRHLSSGSFPIRAPGVFFNSRPFTSIQHMGCPDDPLPSDSSNCQQPLTPDTLLWPAMPGDPSDRFTKMWGLHHNVYPFDPIDQSYPSELRTNLISNPYPYILEGFASDPADREKGVRHTDETTAEIPYCVNAGSPGLIELEAGDLFGVSLDAFRASSGGAVLHPQRSPRFRSGEMTTFEKATAISPSAVFTALPSSVAAIDSGGWGNPHIPDSQNVLLSTAVSDEVSQWSQRDDADDSESDPFDPSPLQPDSGQPPCEEHNGHFCEVYATSLEQNDAFPTIPTDIDFFEWPDSEDPNKINQAEIEEEESGWRNLLCGHSHPDFGIDEETHVNAGVGVGFIGSVAYNPAAPNERIVDEGSTLGFLRLVCAPWSSVPFVTNWPFLRTTGSAFLRGTAQSTISFGELGSLDAALATMAEYRYDDVDTGEEYIRPMSMKTCPPNYFLRGIRFNALTDPSETKRIIGGITELVCSPSSEAPYAQGLSTDDIIRSLYLPEDEQCPFRMGDRCFSRSQYIGWPRQMGLPKCEDTSFPNACAEETICPAGKVVSGFQYRRDSNGFTTDLGLRCIQEPS